MLSSQAQYWLDFFIKNPNVRINYRALMEHGVSRRKSMEILRELRRHGDIQVRRSRGNGTKLELTTVVSSVTTVMQNSRTASNSISNSYTARTDNSATNKFLVGDEEEVKMGWDFFSKSSSDDEDLIRERQKHEAWKKSNYESTRLKKAESRRDKHRSRIDPAHWTCKDVAYEFADRMSNIWSIKPFSMSNSRFVPALSQFRKQYDTDGRIELELIDLFFASVNHEKYTEGDHLWRAFLYKAPSLLQTARERVVTPEQVEADLTRDNEFALRKLSSLDEDEDV